MSEKGGKISVIGISEDYSINSQQDAINEFKGIRRIRFLACILMLLTFIVIRFFDWLEFPFFYVALTLFFEMFINQPYDWIIRTIKKPKLILLTNLIIDVILMTYGIHYVGGMNMFVMLLIYPLAISFTGISLDVKRTFILANLAFVCYAVMVYLEFNGIIETIPVVTLNLSANFRLATTLLVLPCFNLIAYFTSYLTKINREGKQDLKQINYRLQAEIVERRQAELALRESQDTYKAVFESFLDLYYQTDMKGFVTNVSPSCYTLVGYDQDDIIGRPVTDFYPEPKQRKQLFKSILRDGSVNDFELTLLGKDGRHIPVSVNSRIVFDNQGSPLRIEGTIRDITERKLAEKTLRRSEEKYRLLFKNMIVGFAYHKIILDTSSKPVDYIFLDINDVFTKQTGLEKSKIIGKRVTEVIPGIEKSEFDWIGVYGKVALTGEGARFDQYLEPLQRWYSIFVYCPQKGYFATQFVDITERKQTERELSGEKAFSDAAIASLPGIFYVFDEHGKFMRWNHNFESVSGYSGDEIAQMRAAEFFPPDERQSIKEAIGEVFIRGWSSLEANIMSKDGSTTLYYLTGARFEVGGELHLAGMGVDITERNAAEQALIESRNRFKVLSEQNLLAMFFIQDNEIKYANEAAADLFEYPINEIIGWNQQDFTETIHEDDQPFVRDQAIKKQSDDIRAVAHYSLRIITRTGKIKWINLYSKSIIYEGQLADFVTLIDITTQKRVEDIQLTLSKISEASNLSKSLEELLRIIHKTLGNLIDTTNFYIALYNEEDDIYSYPLFIDECEGSMLEPERLPNSLTDYVRRTGEPLYANDKVSKRLEEEHGVATVGEPSPIWLGVPLKIPQGVIGVVVVQSYTNPDIYTKDDLDLLSYVSGHIAVVIERKLAEDALGKSEELLRATVESTADGILVTDIKGNITHTNARFVEMMNIPQEIIESKHAVSLIEHIKIRVSNPEKCLTNLQDPEQTLREKAETIYFKDGQIYERYASPLIQNNELTGMVCNFRDITERKHTEQLLKQSEQKYRSLIESLHDGMGITDLDENMIYANQACCKMFGYPFDELIGMNLSRIVVEEDLPLIRKETEQRKNNKHSKYEVNIKRKDGQISQILISATPLHDNRGDVIATVGIFADVTDIKKAEKEKNELRDKLTRAQRMESLGVLAGGVAHDLNNILGPLVAYPEIIRMGLEPNNPILSHITKIENSAQRAADVVQDLLTMARRGRYEMLPLDFNEMIQTYLDSPDFTKLQANNPEIEVLPDLDTSIPNIHGSVSHLSKVVMNLIINAFEAMPKGGLLAVKTEKQYVEKLIGGFDNIEVGEYLVLTVRDTGFGIDPKDLKHLFEPFYSKKEMGRSGSGLGLAIAYGVIKDHNGYIDVISEISRGSDFVAYLPIIEITAPLDRKAVIDIRGSEKILVVDDIEEQRELAATILSTLGYKVEVAPEGRSAVDYLSHNEADLVILDMIMEDDFDGLETYREIIKKHPGQKAIIASGYSETDRVKEAEKLGVGKYIRKPYTMQKLGKAIREVLVS
ncbi:MAG: PAS domain S-box protein [candidate division Zixibacteria bacterium]|nr:PAS domain S-box protein [candidate division Zixibacteria bacterium]